MAGIRIIRLAPTQPSQHEQGLQALRRLTDRQSQLLESRFQQNPLRPADLRSFITGDQPTPAGGSPSGSSIPTPRPVNMELQRQADAITENTTRAFIPEETPAAFRERCLALANSRDVNDDVKKIIAQRLQ